MGAALGKPYASELDALHDTYVWAEDQDVARLGHFLTRWSSEHVAVVGSGGSYSAAVVVALFRELAHHSPTVAVTPLDFHAMVRRLSPRALLLSAEGKNRDILAAAQSAQAADLASAAITLTLSNPLIEFARSSSALRPFAFQMDWVKDGYLATNSLVATVLLAYRALFDDAGFKHDLAPLFAADRMATRRAFFAGWSGLQEARSRGVLVLYSSQTKAFAVDLESKLAEAALAPVQIADLRQFAHGRHLQLAMASPAPCVLVVSTAMEHALAAATASQFPSGLRWWDLVVDGRDEQDVAVAALLDAMFFTEAISRHAPHDPGQPPVPEFGRAIHAIDSAKLLPASRKDLDTLQLAARRKSSAGAHELGDSRAQVLQAAAKYASKLTTARIKALVCDFDGTLCRVENRFGQIAPEHVEQISALVRQGLRFAIATGRGGSLHSQLQRAFEPDLHQAITVGYYSGSTIARLDEEFIRPPPNPDFQALCDWLAASVYSPFWKPLEDLVRGGQLCLRVDSAAQSARLQSAITQWLVRSGRRDWRVFTSGHSVDVLDGSTSKRNVVEHIAREAAIDPLQEVLRLGDSGHEGGNDYELLDAGLSLSCERVSTDMDACWNFGQAGANQTEVTMRYLRGLVRHDGAFRMTDSALLSI